MAETNTPRPMDAAGECFLYYEFIIRVNYVLHGRLAYPNHSTGEESDQPHYLDHRRGFDRLGSQHHHADEESSGLIADIIVGIVGAFAGGYFLSHLFHVTTINEGNFSIPAVLVSLGGAVILLDNGIGLSLLRQPQSLAVPAITQGI